MVGILKVGTAEARSRERSFGVIEVGELQDGTIVNIPVILVHGKKSAPILYVDAAAHGPEIGGTGTIIKIIREKVDPNILNGSIIAIPVANPLAFRYARYTPLQDEVNLNRSYPGDPNGTITQRIAHSIWQQAASKANYIITFHANSNPCIPYIYIKPKFAKNQETLEKAQVMAEAFGVTIIHGNGKVAGNLAATAVANGIPGMGVELMGARRIEKSSVEVGVRGLLNVMKSLGMIDGEIEEQTGVRVLKGTFWSGPHVRANHGGLVELEKEPGEAISKGEVIARIFNIYGDEIEAVKMPVDGFTWAYPMSYTGFQTVATGDRIAYTFQSKE